MMSKKCTGALEQIFSESCLLLVCSLRAGVYRAKRSLQSGSTLASSTKQGIASVLSDADVKTGCGPPPRCEVDPSLRPVRFHSERRPPVGGSQADPGITSEPVIQVSNSRIWVKQGLGFAPVSLRRDTRVRTKFLRIHPHSIATKFAQFSLDD